jgi:hypothetical protein
MKTKIEKHIHIQHLIGAVNITIHAGSSGREAQECQKGIQQAIEKALVRVLSDINSIL